MTTTFHDTISTTSTSRWSRVRKYKSLVQSKLLRWLFCVDDQLLHEIQEESKLRDEVRDAMVVHNTGAGTAGVSHCMKEIYNDTGYDMANYSSFVEETVKTAEEPHEAEKILRKMGIHNRSGIPERHQVMVVPRFAASVVLCLRAKFGNLQATEANRLLIEREYLKVCREGTVRNVDIVAHQQIVLNTYFGEGVLDEQNTVRVRAPRWLREAFGSVPRVAPTIC